MSDIGAAMADHEINIRAGDVADLSALVDIYNHYVVETHITFDTEPFPVAARTQWFRQFSDEGPYRLLVGTQGDDVVGYASSSQFKPRAAYNSSVETTVYVDPSHAGQGFGHAIYSDLVECLIAEPTVHRAYGGVALPNPQSVALHERLGFTRVASFHEVGFKFGKYWDVSWFEKGV